MAALFTPFRALGYITDGTSVATQRRGKDTFVTVSVGKAWQVYNCAKLLLSLVGPEFPHNIRALASKGDLTFAAVKSSIVECKRVHRTGQYDGHKGNIIQLMVLGEQLLSLGEDCQLLVWRIGKYDEPEATIKLDRSFGPTCMAHPDAYLNKVVVGGSKGQVQLWNIVSGQLLHTFQPGSSAILCLQPAPALDCMGIGMADGSAQVLNLRFDEVVARFANASGVGLDGVTGPKSPGLKAGAAMACRSLSFSTGTGDPLMVAGGASGAMTVWNLETQRLQTVVPAAHAGAITSLHFFPGEPRLLSAGADNSLRQWVFDSVDGSARLLKLRSGHGAPPSCVRYYNEGGTRLLSAGRDRAFRVFSTVQDQQSRELSQHHTQRRAKRLKLSEAELKLPPVIGLDACQVRERDWCNVVTAHEGSSTAYTWRLQHFTLGTALQPAQAVGREATGEVTAVCVSRCGNFAFVGTAAGCLDRYNMQSGAHRGSYCRPSPETQDAASNAHDRAVTGVAGDMSNKLLISVGLDSWLRIWDFRAASCRIQLALPSPASKLSFHPGSSLAALACDDWVIRMYDVETGRLVRQLRGHSDRITDLSISSDGRWLLAASMDAHLRVYDIPSARLLQALHMGPPITSFSLAPDLGLLATAHTQRRGIYLWANQTIFGSGDSAPKLTGETADARLPALTADQPEVIEVSDDEAMPENGTVLSEDESADTDVSLPDSSPPAEPAAVGQPELAGPWAPELVTLSMLPRSVWQSLVHLDAIKERNKPIQPPAKPKAAPFFLPTVPGFSGRPEFASDDSASAAAAQGSRVGKLAGSLTSGSPLLLALRKGSEGCATALELLRGMAPVAIDREFRALQIVDEEDQEGLEDLRCLFACLQAAVHQTENFEFVQGLLRLALQVHGQSIAADADLAASASSMQAQLGKVWGRLDDAMARTRCMLGFLSGSVA